MVGIKAAATAATLLVAATLPAAAQQPRPNAGPGVGGAAPNAAPNAPGPGTAVSPALVSKTGAAMRQVTDIRQSYAPRVAAARNDDEKQTLQQQAMDQAVRAINDQGLSVDQYNQVIRLAQADPTLQEQLLSAAQTSGK